MTDTRNSSRKVTSDHFIIKHLLSFKFIYFMCIIVLSTCRSVHHMHPCCPQRSEVCARFPGTGILYRDNCEPLCGYWEMNLDPLLRAKKSLKHGIISAVLVIIILFKVNQTCYKNQIVIKQNTLRSLLI